MLSALIAGLLCCQDPKPAPANEPTPPPQQQSPPAGGGDKPAAVPQRHVEAWDDQLAKAKVRDFQKVLKGKPGMAVRSQALDDLAGGQNAQLVKPLADFVQSDDSVVLKKRAVELLGDQPADKANSAILQLLDSKASDSAAVQAELIRALSRCGYEPRHWQKIDDLFERNYDPSRVAVHEAILDLVAAHGERQAVPMLLRNLDEPVPRDVDGAANPPADYWKARWTSWSAWRSKVKDALFAVTGQRFSTVDEAKAWLAKNPLKAADSPANPKGKPDAKPKAGK